MNRVLGHFHADMSYWEGKKDTSMVDMITSDFEYNATSLGRFLEDRDIKALRDRIYDQDTAPREEFWRVLDLIEGDQR